MNEIFEFIAGSWTEWLFAAVTAALAAFCRNISSRLKAEQKKSEAIAEGVQALLRDSIVIAYNKYQEREYCPIYAKESVKKAYSAYHKLGGNDVVTELYHKLLTMPERPEKEEINER